MFSDEITTSDAFLDMPTESQNLYFHLGMTADDDGFISNTKMVQRVVGASDDSLKILFAKKFLIPFNEGICVVKHWRINNQIRKDRYRETKHIREKSKLFIRSNGSYSMKSENALPVPGGHFSMEEIFENQGDNSGCQVVAPGKVSIGKVREDKNKIDLPIWLNKKAWDAWVEYKKERKQKLTPSIIKFQLRILEKNKEDHPEIIRNSITNGWTGLFPLKKERFQKRIPPRFVEPSTSKEDNDRRNELNNQAKKLSEKFKVD